MSVSRKRGTDEPNWDERLLKSLYTGFRRPSSSPETRKKCLNIMKECLDHGANPNQMVSSESAYCVHIVAAWPDDGENDDDDELPLNIQAMKLLLEYRAILHVITPKRGATVMHHAAFCGTPRMVKFLLDMGCVPAAVDGDGRVPVSEAILRDSKESVPIIKMLLPLSVKVSFATPYGNVLNLACLRSTNIEIIETILAIKKDYIYESTAKGGSALMMAARNRSAGHLFIPLLLAQGADVTYCNPKGENAFLSAYCFGSVASVNLLSFSATPNALSNHIFEPTDPNPIGKCIAGKPFGGSKVSTDALIISAIEEMKYPERYIWFMYRYSMPTINSFGKQDILRAISKAKNPRIWKLLQPDLSVHLMGTERETMLHLAVRSNDLQLVRNAMQWRINPFLPNTKLQRPIDLTKDPAIRAALVEYARFYPTVHHAQWYGPYFVMRAFTFLLLVHRWKTSGTLNLGKDLTLHILRCIADAEAV